MCTRTGFHANEAGRQLSDQREQLIALDTRFDQYRLAGFIHSVNRKDALGKIYSDGDNGHGLPLPLVLMKVETSSWHVDADWRLPPQPRNGEVPFIRHVWTRRLLQASCHDVKTVCTHVSGLPGGRLPKHARS
ncbi:hypothetical protein, partial [Paraburkholderia aspalathi]|uniref:hypothetical protein n=1 Tax=Paraburkholderia aspalathi TaxID=1324617 RepID=UPI001FD5E514